MKKVIALLLCAAFIPGLAFAEDDHHACKQALDELDAATASAGASASKNDHHEHQQAKEARDKGDYKKCADQANKAREHMQQG